MTETPPPEGAPPPEKPRNPGWDNPAFTARAWKPGQSGNPAGKLKGLPSFGAALRRELARTDRRNKQNIEKIAAKVVALAMKGDMDAVRWLADRVDGKVAQTMNVNSEQTITVVPWLPAVQQALANPEDETPELEGVQIEDEVEVDD